MTFNTFIEKMRGRITQSFVENRTDYTVASNDSIKKFLANKDSPVLVSFPRTGSHWLRMILELYFDRPLLTRSFFKHANSDSFLFLHSHDIDLKLYRRNVIYLHRDPRHTIFSQMMYRREPLEDKSRVVYWSKLYLRHLEKWMIEENYAERKTILSYEALRDDSLSELNRAIIHLEGNGNTDIERLSEVLSFVSKEKVKEKTTHDSQVVNIDRNYNLLRGNFESQFSDLIFDIFLDSRAEMKSFFDIAESPR